MKHKTPLNEVLKAYGEYVFEMVAKVEVPKDYHSWFQLNFLSGEDRHEQWRDERDNRKIAVLKEDGELECNRYYFDCSDVDLLKIKFVKGQAFDGILGKTYYSVPYNEGNLEIPLEKVELISAKEFEDWNNIIS